MDLSCFILDPSQHQNAVKLFCQYYNIQPKWPDLPFLEEIVGHYRKLPYENLSKIIKLQQFFDSTEHFRLPEEVIEDHLRYKLGGTCFSLTFFLCCILLQHQFLCYPVIASMKNRPYSHSAILVLLENKKYLVDPGYLLANPMEIHPDFSRFYQTVQTGVELVFQKETERYHLYTFNAEQKTWRYQFQDYPISWKEFLGYWENSFYQGTMRHICLTQVREQGLIYIQNKYVKIVNSEKIQKKRIQRDMEWVVQDLFGIAPELVEKARLAIPENLKKVELMKPKEKKNEA